MGRLSSSGGKGAEADALGGLGEGQRVPDNGVEVGLVLR